MIWGQPVHATPSRARLASGPSSAVRGRVRGVVAARREGERAGEEGGDRKSLENSNKSAFPLYRFQATTKSDDGMFDKKELVLGKIDPGKTRTATIPLGWCDVEGHKPGSTAPLPKDAPHVCRLPRDTLSRQNGITVKFDEARGRAPAEQTLRVSLRALSDPSSRTGRCWR